MGIYDRLQLMQINGLLDETVKDTEIIYKIIFNPTGEFYIGRSRQIQERIAQHMYAIIGECKGYGPRPTVVQPWHHLMAERMAPILAGKSAKKTLESAVRDNLRVYLIAIVEPEWAGATENYYIAKHAKDPLFLNSRK